MAIRKDGAFIEITLPNGKFSYGRILPKANYGIYDVYSDNQITDVDKLRAKRILFIVAVYKHAITKNRWKTIGFLPLESILMNLPLKFIQDDFDYNHFEIYDSNTGVMRPAKKIDCIGLERAAVWEPEHVESRIIDHFEGRPNKWVESLKIKE